MKESNKNKILTIIIIICILIFASEDINIIRFIITHIIAIIIAFICLINMEA